MAKRKYKHPTKSKSKRKKTYGERKKRSSKVRKTGNQVYQRKRLGIFKHM